MASVHVSPVVEDYLSHGDFAKENANIPVNPAGLILAVGGEGLKEDNLHRLRKEGFGPLADAHEMGMVHIHDLSLGFATPYCAGHSLSVLLNEGIQAGPSRSLPAKHLRTAVSHMVNYIGAAANEFAGAQAFNDVDLLLAPYAHKHFLDLIKAGLGRDLAREMTVQEVRQCAQEFIFGLNVSNRFGGQTPFSNITLAMVCPKDMEEQVALVGGEPLVSPDGKTIHYGDLDFWQTKMAEAFLDVFIGGDAEGKGFTFPVLTVNVTPDFFTNPLRWKVYELTAKFGTPMFQNFVSGMSGGKLIKPEDVRAMCCRLSIDQEQVRHVGGSFGNADQTGSLQVVTISLPYLAMMAKALPGAEKQAFLISLYGLMNDIKDEQLWKRGVVEDYFERGFFPMARSNFKRGFSTFFTTIGYIGLWEAVEILTGDKDSFLTEEGMGMAKEISSFMAKTVDDFTKETGKLFNLEATPAESASYKLAKKLLRTYPDAPARGTPEAPYLTNSCHIPVERQDDLSLVFLTQAQLQTIPSGGTATHFYTEEELTPADVETAIKTVCGTPIPYFSLSVCYSICPICGRKAGLHDFCEHTEDEVKRAGLEGSPDVLDGLR